MPAALNPYTERGMIRDPERFFGRERELREIFSRLATMQSVSVVGERRIGKSSLLYQVERRGAERLDGSVYHYLDLQRVLSSEEFYARVCQLLGVSGDSHQDFEQAIAGKRVILCLDEFEQTTDNLDFDENFFQVLRSLAQTGELALVTATQHRLSDLSRSEAIPTSPFFNIFSVLTLGPLTENEAQELMTRPAERAGFPFIGVEIRFIRELAQTHPYWLNVACALLYDAKQRGTVDLEAVRREFSEQQRAMKTAAVRQPQPAGIRRLGQDLPTPQPSEARGDTGTALFIAVLLALAGVATGWIGTSTNNPVGVMFAAGLLLIALGTLVKGWLDRSGKGGRNNGATPSEK